MTNNEGSNTATSTSTTDGAPDVEVVSFAQAVRRHREGRLDPPFRVNDEFARICAVRLGLD